MTAWETSFLELSGVAMRQLGMVTSAQVRRIGVDEASFGRLVEADLIFELDSAVYQLTGSTTAPRYGYPYAAWLAIAPGQFAWERPTGAGDAVLSHESASRLLGLGSLPAPHTVFTAPEEKAAPRATRIRVARLAPEDVTVVQGVPVTTAHRTVLDLLHDWTDPDQLGRVLFDAVLRDLVDLAALHADLVPFAQRYHFPAYGPGFIDHFALDLMPGTLSLRNLRALTALRSPDRVAAVRDELLRAVPWLTDSDRVTSDVAAEIVARTGS